MTEIGPPKTRKMQRPACHTGDSLESVWVRVAAVLAREARLRHTLGTSRTRRYVREPTSFSPFHRWPAMHAHPPKTQTNRTISLAVFIVSCLLSATMLGGCSKSPVDKLIDESVGHLEAAHTMMVDNAGNVEKLGIAVVQYRSKHRGEFRKLRIAGEKALKALPEAERKAVMERAQKRTLPLSQKIETAAGRYKDKRLALRVVRPLMVTATPRGLKKGQRPPWLPKFKEMPNDKGGSHGHKHGPAGHGHNHGPAGHGHNHGAPAALPAAATPKGVK